MSKLSFKQFSTLVDLPNEPTEEQLEEMFGWFSNSNKTQADKEKLAKTKNAIEAQRRAKNAKEKEIAKEKDKLFKGGQISKTVAPFVPSGRTSAAAQGRAAEREFVAQLANETANLGLDKELESIARRIYSGKIDVTEILRGDVNNVSKEAVKYIEHLADEVSHDKRLHPDNDFEQINFEVGTRLITDFYMPNYRG